MPKSIGLKAVRAGAKKQDKPSTAGKQPAAAQAKVKRTREPNWSLAEVKQLIVLQKEAKKNHLFKRSDVMWNSIPSSAALLLVRMGSLSSRAASRGMLSGRRR